MQSRRKFLKTASFTIATAAFSVPLSGAALLVNRLPSPGVQLYTYFNFIEKDVFGTLQKVAESGIINVETSFSEKGDYYGLSVNEFSKVIKNLGMKWRSHHVFGTPISPKSGGKVRFKNLLHDEQQIIDEAAEGGIQYLVAAHMPISTTREIYHALDILNSAAEACEKSGIQLIYHNETNDFAKVDGMIPYDVFLTETDINTVKFELDFAWAIKAGINPVDLIDRFPGRFPLWHIKDFNEDMSSIVPVGQGIIRNETYFKLAEKAGLKYYFIEHEAAEDPFNSVKESIVTIKRYPG